MEAFNDEFEKKIAMAFFFSFRSDISSGFCGEAIFEKVGIHELYKVVIFKACVCLKLS